MHFCVLAARLYGRRAGAEEDVLELVHAGVGEEQRRVVERHDAATTARRCGRASCTKKSMNCWRISLADGIGVFHFLFSVRSEPAKYNADSLRTLNDQSAWLVTLTDFFEHLAQRNVVGASHAGTIIVFRSEDRRPSFQPAEFTRDRSPGSIHSEHLALKLVPIGGIAADAKGHGLPEKDLLEIR